MKRTLSFILILSLVISLLGFTPMDVSAATSGTVFLMGGAISDDNSEIFEALYQAAGGTGSPVVAVFCSGASNLAAAEDAYYNDIPGHLSYKNLFERYGFTPVFVPIAADNYTTAAYNQNNIDIVNSAKVVFFNGGDQARHARSLLKDDGTDTPLMAAVRSVYNNGGVISGTSAGAAIQGNPTYGEGNSVGYLYHNDMAEKSISDVSLKDPNDSHDHNGGYTTGFGFIDAAVDTHFDARGRLGRMIVAMRELNKALGIGVDEDTAFSVSNGVGTVYGTNGVFIGDSSNATFPTASYFKATNAAVSYLTSGDSYNLNTKTVTSTKSLIGTPYYSSGYDSDDIFYPYETTYVMTRLVDSPWSYAYGDTYDPDRYVKMTFTLKFQKTASTKGYYRSGKYTVSKMRVDIYY